MERGTVVAVAAAAALSTAVVACAALEGAASFHPPFTLGPIGEDGPAAPVPTSTATPLPRSISGYTDLHWVVIVAVVVAIAVAVLLLLLPLRAFLRRARRVAVSLDAPPAVPAVGHVRTVESEEPDSEVVQRGIRAAIDSWSGARDPADAVIRAWLALQQTADDAGVGRSPAETPSEFAVRVLARTAADRAAVRELLALYLAARFADRPTTEAESGRARAALESIERSWALSAAR